MLIGSRQQLAKVSVEGVRIGDSTIVPSTTVRDLGVTLDNSMTMAAHISTVCRSAFYHLWRISKIRRYLTSRACEQMIHAFVTSRLDMGNVLLYGLPQTQLRRLQLVQNSAARLITYASRYDHITPVLHQLHWLPIVKRILFKLLLLTFKALNGMGPTYLTELLQPARPLRALRSSARGLQLVEPRTRHSWGDRAFASAAPKQWNLLPASVQNANTLTDFKRKLKSHLFTQ
jgi:hypothetical protein